MRQIKFRAWDKEENEMFFCDMSDLCDTKALDFRISVSVGDAVVDQFTGLHDKNGKEIYEGDILIPTLGTPRLVVFNQSCMKTSITLKTKSGSLIDVGIDSNNYLTVIGNIHENPELLESK